MDINKPITKNTPIVDQYLRVKSNYKDSILFFRMGDFYEMLFEDAVLASKILGIILTKRSNSNEVDIPMAGVPFHSYEGYVSRLIKRGYKVAICEQLETPTEAKQRGNKSIVNRDVVRVITPGTVFEDAFLETSSYNYLVCLIPYKNQISLAWSDISIGNFFVYTVDATEINNMLYRVRPKELLIERNVKPVSLSDEFAKLFTEVSLDKFNDVSVKNFLVNFYQCDQSQFSNLNYHELLSCAALLDYLEYTQKDSLVSLCLPQQYHDSNYMRMDFFTIRSLEILKNYSGGDVGSLRSVINKTVTAIGSRVLTEWLSRPLVDCKEITQRHDCIEYFVKSPEILLGLRNQLKKIADIERSLGRIRLTRGTVFDVYKIRDSLRILLDIRYVFFSSKLPEYLKLQIDSLGDYNVLLNDLNNALLDPIPTGSKDLNYINAGYRKDYDAYQILLEEKLNAISVLQAKYASMLGVSSIKINYNNLLGYFIEVPNRYVAQVNQHDIFKHKHSTTNVVRYITEELTLLEIDILKYQGLVVEMGKIILEKLMEHIRDLGDDILQTTKIIGLLDVLSSFAILSNDYNLTRPAIDNSKKFDIKGGRHLVVEHSLKVLSTGEEFVTNDCNMAEDIRILLLTGPNMSGKSTYLRQNALIILMAQIGCFIPSSYGEIGVCDALYSRVGASDDLFKGKSTFMVEMQELGVILNNATDRSFIILDEIGRGTSTYDGVSIAWSSLEYLHNKIQCRTLFATHYHELTLLEKKLAKLSCYYVDIREDQGKVLFMYAVTKGSLNKSFGIEVAKLAGMPSQVTKEASLILQSLEKTNPQGHKLLLESVIQPDLFDSEVLG